MTATERKQHTEDLLKKWHIPVFSDLPALEEESNTRLRTPQEITGRILILSYLNCLAKEPGLKQEITELLKDEHLWEMASGHEKLLFEKAAFTEGDINTIAWRDESIWLLLWAINKVDTLGLPVEEVNTYDIIRLLPPFLKSTVDFVQSATIRAVSEILDQADLIFRLNWTMHQIQAEDLDHLKFNMGVAYERYFAINWLTCMREQWDSETL